MNDVLSETLGLPGGIVSVMSTFLVVILGIAFFSYIFTSAVNAMALRKIGYKKAWLAWVPYLCYWAIADATKKDGYYTTILGRWNCPNTLYTLWFVLLFVIRVIDGGAEVWFPNSLGMFLEFLIMFLT